MPKFSVIVPIHFEYELYARTEAEAIERGNILARNEMRMVDTIATSIEVQDNETHAGEMEDE